MHGIKNRKSSLCCSFFLIGMYCFILCTNVFFLFFYFFLAHFFCSVFTTVFFNFFFLMLLFFVHGADFGKGRL